MSDLQEEFYKLKAIMDKHEADRLWDHFIQTGQVLPTTQENMKKIDEIQKQIHEIEKIQYVYPFPGG